MSPPQCIRIVRCIRSATGGLASALVAVAASAILAGPAFAAEAAPRPDSYLCPNTVKLGVDCFLEAVEHLYTMCRQIKSIEILEFGYEKAEEGTNGAKTEYCIDKHRASMARPFQAAIKEASRNREALEAMRSLHETWLRALADLKWHPPESDDEYKGRVAKPYDEFHERAGVVRTALEVHAPAARTSKPVARTAGASAR